MGVTQLMTIKFGVAPSSLTVERTHTGFGYNNRDDKCRSTLWTPFSVNCAILLLHSTCDVAILDDEMKTTVLTELFKCTNIQNREVSNQSVHAAAPLLGGWDVDMLTHEEEEGGGRRRPLMI